MPQYFNFLEAVVERRADPASAASDWHWLLGSCPFSQALCCPGHQQGRLCAAGCAEQGLGKASSTAPVARPLAQGSSGCPEGQQSAAWHFFFFFFFLIWCIWAVGLCKVHGVSQALLLMQHPKQPLLPPSLCWKLQGLICVVPFPSFPFSPL